MDYTLKSTSSQDKWVDYTVTPRIVDTFMEAGRTRSSQKPKQAAIDLLKRNLETTLKTPFTHEFIEAIPGENDANTLILQDNAKNYTISITSVTIGRNRARELLVEAKPSGASTVKDAVIQAFVATVDGIDLKVEEDKEKAGVVARVLQKQGVPATPGTGPIENILGYAGITRKPRGGRKRKTRRSKRRMLHRPKTLKE